MLDSTNESILSSIKAKPLYERIQLDLLERLNSFPTTSAAYASFEKLTNKDRRTLKNFLGSKSTPYPSTIVCFYKWVYKTEKESEVLEQLSFEIKNYLKANGYNINLKKKDLNHIIFKSKIHFELYLMSEDNNVFSRNTVLRLYGEAGKEALDELLLEEVVSAISDETFTTGRYRADQTTKYFQEASALMHGLVPWAKLEKNPMTKDAVANLGNFLVPKGKEEEVDKLVGEFWKRLNDLHTEGLKVANSSKVTNYLYSLLLFKPKMSDVCDEETES